MNISVSRPELKYCWVEGNCCYLLILARVEELPAVIEASTINQSIHQSINQQSINTMMGRRELLLSNI